jgi:hypothetical protein
MIGSEDPKPSQRPQIPRLAKENIDIARRTVAKYRELLGILPSSKRKRYVGRLKRRARRGLELLMPTTGCGFATSRPCGAAARHRQTKREILTAWPPDRRTHPSIDLGTVASLIERNRPAARRSPTASPSHTPPLGGGQVVCAGRNRDGLDFDSIDGRPPHSSC